MADNNNGDVPKGLKKINPWLKMTLLILGIAAFIGGGIWQLNVTFASKNHVIAVENNAEKARTLLAEESVKVLQNFQDKMRQEQRQKELKSDIRELDWRMNQLIEDIENIKRQLCKDPESTYLKNKLKNKERSLEQYKKRWDELLK